MSEPNSYGNRDGQRRGGKSFGGDKRRQGNGGRRFDRGERGDDRRGGYRNRNDDRRDGGRRYDRDDRRCDRGDHRGNHGDARHDRRRDDRRDAERGYGRDDRRRNNRGDFRDDRRGDRRHGGRGSQGGNHTERRGHEGRDDRHRDGARDKKKSYSPQRSGFREERLNRRMTDPDIPSDIDVNDLDPLVLQDLRVLSKENADAVAKHMIMAATWMEDDPQLALRHARAAKDRAGRVAVAREVCGIAAYRAGEWKEALSELRAARRMTGGPGMIAVMADCERGLGRPEKAIELGRSDEANEVDAETAIELAIVVAGARLDMGQAESAVVTLQRANPSKDDRGLSATRLSYAYANALAEAGRKDEAIDWFQHAASIDEGEWTDAQERLRELGA